ncbi:MAG: hypothetical protein IJO64_06555 [Clostridia bacterium]|nr:hypothetical protein [Clostridia bacterium]
MAEYLIGIDGGGSKTDFLLCDKQLNEKARRFAGRSNPNDIGIDAVAELIKENVLALLSENGVSASEISAAFAGIAGASNDDNVVRLTAALKSVLPNAKAEAFHDGINVLYGAFPYEDGVSIICGTGSSCFIKKGEEIIRIGGYGSFDLSGNGYEIGRAGLAHALKTIDGRAEFGIMDELIAERVGNDFLVALDKMLIMTKNELASFAPTVFEAASRGDDAALAIIDENMDYIAELINRAGVYFKNDYKVALAGGIMKSEIAVSLLSTKLNSRARLIKSEIAPVFGAAARALQLL